MELIYLWVEDYKNIQKQGFNFSPRFECKFYDEYDNDGKLKDNCKLVICDKEKGECLDNDTKKCKPCQDNGYIKDFFGDNINVTAIVGKNGSGKSSILKFIRKIIDNKDNKVKDGSFLVFYKKTDDKYICIYTKNKINADVKLEQDDIISQHIIFPLFDYSLTYDSSINFEYVYPNKYKAYICFNRELIRNQKNIINNYLDLQEKKQLDKFEKFFQPNKILIKFNFSKFEQEKNKLKSEKLEEYEELKKNIQSSKQIDENLIKQIKNIFNIFKDENNYIKKELNEVSKLDWEALVHSFDFDIDDRKQEENEYNIWYKDFDTKKLNNIIDKNECTKIEVIDKGDSLSANTTSKLFLLNIDSLSKDYIDIIMISFDFKDFFEIELIGKDERKLSDLSFGEQQLLFILNQLYSLGTQNNSDVTILLDEIDIGFHPDWQKRTIQYIIDFLSLITVPSKKFHLIFTTHSPFLLSDIPKQNIIFLDTDEEGNCKVVDGLSQTFGANIHTLLSDSFFMEDGLMGEFAKGKINNVIKFLKNEKSDIKDKNEAKKIIEIIGEPFLKQKLEKMYAKNFHEDIIDIKIKILEEEIERLKNVKNRQKT